MAVRRLSGRTTAQQVVESLEADLRDGGVALHSELRLRDLADRHGLRVEPLELTLRRLVDAGLITVRGGYILVCALRPEEITRLCELQRTIGLDLAGRMHRRVSPAKLDDLEKLVDQLESDRIGALSASAWGAALRRFDATLLGGVAAQVELQIRGDILAAMRRYIAHGWLAIRFGASGDRPDDTVAAIRVAHLGSLREQIDALRSGGPGAVRAVAARREADRNELCARSLVPANIGPRLTLVG